MSAASLPYSRPAPTRITCVDNRTNRRAKSYEVSKNEIKIASYKTTTISALSDGVRAFIAPVDGEIALFETGRAYIIKNYTLSHKFGRECIFLNPNSKKFQTASFELPEEAERSAKYLLNPPTALLSGEEQDLFTRGGFISLKGEIEKLQVPRMTRVGDGEVPIRDLSLRCGQVVVEVSLWRDEALVELSLGDHIEISCLRARLKPSPKLNSSSYSAVEKTVAEPVEVELTFIGVLEGDGGATVLLSDAYEEYTVLAAPALDIAADDLPIKLTLTHRNKTVQSIEPLGEMFEGMFEEV
ncbi:putative C-mannosyltransferase DPY19L3 isoform X1 [Labeo rohita]|uniref:Putative C-mannosyltransferase DPY19L3 isoform X1 n=1 Tax=Labeo rohita TaxID=84645 RepID=A0A498M418_LABRO|nr:putative C-mannosyltransferase DPY19L3 isoform X1 [Labeo rohita]